MTNERPTYSTDNTVAELQALCEAAGLETTGTKAELITRLDGYYSAQEVPTFARETFATSKVYKNKADAVRTVMTADEKITIAELESRLAAFYNTEVIL